MTSLRQTARALWRLYQPLRHTRGPRVLRLPAAYVRYFRQLRAFRRAGGRADTDELAPIFFDDDPGTQSGGGHYFYQDVWALSRLADIQPGLHHDVGSRIDGFVGQATAICPVVFWDIRPPAVRLRRFEYRSGSIDSLPVPDWSLASVSCLHTAEHIGLGRYGDQIDPHGTARALKELMRVLAPGGQLLFSMPVGRERTCFNAQRVWCPTRPVAELGELTLVEFAAVTDADEFVTDIEPTAMAGAKYACGLYRFTRPVLPV